MDIKNGSEGSGFTITPKETPKINITPKEKGIEITPKERPEIEIREIFRSRIKEMVGDHGNDTLRIISDFGQSWNLANLTVEDAFHFSNITYREINNPEIEGKIYNFYNTLVRLNPELKNIETNGDIVNILHIIRGVGSGLHFNDIKYFVEVLKGNAENTPEEDQALEYQALEAFYLRNGLSAVEFDERDAEKIEAEIDAIEESYGLESLNFALSPETSRRVIENRPYKEG